MNPNYKEINVEESINNPDSIYQYYKQIIELRKKHDIIVYGNYTDIEFKNKKLYSYRRYKNKEELIVLCNFTDSDYLMKQNEYLKYDLILSNYKENDDLLLKPYEARVYMKRVK